MKKDRIVMNVAEVKMALDSYQKLEDKAQEILKAGSCGCESITGMQLDKDGDVEIYYCTYCRGERYEETEYVPTTWFGIEDPEELQKLWYNKRSKARKAAEAAARREEKRRKEAERREELATLKRLKAKYPDA